MLKNVVDEDAGNGLKSYLSCLCWYFVKWSPEMQKTIATVLNKSIEAGIMSADQVLKWADKEIKLNKASSLFFRKKEREFKELAEEFFNWLRDQDESESSSSDDDDSGSGSDEEESKEEIALKKKQ